MKDLKKLMIVVLFLFVGMMGYTLSAYSVTTNGVVVITTGSSTESTTSGTSTDSTTDSTTTSGTSTENTSNGTTVKGKNRFNQKDSWFTYPRTGENVKQNLFIRTVGFVLILIVVIVGVKKISTKKEEKKK